MHQVLPSGHVPSINQLYHCFLCQLIFYHLSLLPDYYEGQSKLMLYSYMSQILLFVLNHQKLTWRSFQLPGFPKQAIGEEYRHILYKITEKNLLTSINLKIKILNVPTNESKLPQLNLILKDRFIYPLKNALANKSFASLNIDRNLGIEGFNV